jgi:hypothetical protein
LVLVPIFINSLQIDPVPILTLHSESFFYSFFLKPNSLDPYRYHYLLIFTKSPRYRYFYIYSTATHAQVWVFRWSVPVPLFIDFHQVDPVPILLYRTLNLNFLWSLPVPLFIDFVESTRYRYFYIAHSNLNLLFISTCTIIYWFCRIDPVPILLHCALKSELAFDQYRYYYSLIFTKSIQYRYFRN